MAGRKKLQDVFVDRKVPRSVRARIPIVEGTNGILWVVGYAVAAQARVAGGRHTVTLIAEAEELLW